MWSNKTSTVQLSTAGLLMVGFSGSWSYTFTSWWRYSKNWRVTKVTIYHLNTNFCASLRQTSNCGDISVWTSRQTLPSLQMREFLSESVLSFSGLKYFWWLILHLRANTCIYLLKYYLGWQANLTYHKSHLIVTVASSVIMVWTSEFGHPSPKMCLHNKRRSWGVILFMFLSGPRHPDVRNLNPCHNFLLTAYSISHRNSSLQMPFKRSKKIQRTLKYNHGEGGADRNHVGLTDALRTEGFTSKAKRG